MATDGYWLQDSHVLPPEIEDIFRRVQDSAHYMPDWQMEVAYLVLQPQHDAYLSLSESTQRVARPIMDRQLRVF